MDIQLLEDIGLTKVQAAAYKALIDYGAQTAPALATHIAESRSNGYKVLDKLVELGLAVKELDGGKHKYAAVSPAALEEIIKRKAEQVHQKERRLNSELPRLIDYYFAHSERPSIRYYEGAEGLRKIYKDQLTTNRPLRFIQANNNYDALSFDELHKIRNMFPRFGIARQAITLDKLQKELPKKDRMPVDKSDEAMMLQRTWISPNDYTAPVEWTVYDNKLSIVQYGQQVMGMVIESEAIADAFRQLYALLDEGIHRRPDYKQFPRKATYTAIPDRLRKTKPTF